MFASDFERKLYAVLCKAAESGLPCPITDDLVEALGCESNATPAECLRRLEQAGLVSARRYQKHRVVTITATGRSTAEPMSPKIHWRDRPLGRANAALELVDTVHPGAADAIRAMSKASGVAVPLVVVEMIQLGWKAMKTGSGSVAIRSH